MTITFEYLQPAIALAGLDIVTQTSWHKVARDRKALYISRTKKSTTACHVAGFTLDHPAVLQLSAEQAKAKKLGKVRGIIDMAHPEALEAVELALVELTNGSVGFKFQKMTEVERLAKVAAAKAERTAAAAAKAARKAKIAARAAARA